VPLSLSRRFTLGGIVFAATLPILFLHVDYQPAVSLHAGGTSANVKLSDVMVLLTVLAAAATAARRGLAPLRRGRPIWLTEGALLAWIVAAVFYPLASTRAYPWRTHIVTAGEFGEYMLLAPAAVLLLRRRADAWLAGGVLVVWTIAATAVGIAQWAGWSGLHGWGAGHRQPSFLGTHDFASLSAMTLGAGIVALLWHVTEKPLRIGAWVALVTGVVGFVLGGATAGIVGLVPAGIVAAAIAAKRGLVSRRALVATGAATAIASLGVLALRAGDFNQFLRFVGAEHRQSSTTANIQTYSQRTLLAYIGLRIWLHHPVIGVGWQGSSDPSSFERELPAAHRRFPHVAQIAFPSAQHPYGVQILYVQALADLGVIGFLLLVAVFAAGVAVALRRAVREPPDIAFAVTLAAFWIVLSLGLWSAEGLVAGIPLDALTWLGFGLAAAHTAHA